MRTRKLLVGGAVATFALISPFVTERAFAVEAPSGEATTEVDATEAGEAGSGEASGADSTGEAEGELTHAAEECIHLLEEGKPIDACQEAPNPILPTADEILWGTVAFAVVFFGLWKFGIPAVKKTMQARSDKIAGDLKAAEGTRAEADKLIADYRAQLADAKSEANRIIDEARQQAEVVRKDVLARAEADAAAVRAKATEDLNLQAERIKVDLQSHVKSLSLDLAEKVVGANLNNETNAALIDRYIAELSNR